MRSLLTLSAGHTSIAAEGLLHVTMPVGPATIVDQAFRQGPPNAAQLESAINLVEDAILATGLHATPRGTLVADVHALHEALGVMNAPAHLSLAQVEQRYQDIAMPAQRFPSAPVLDL
ncbi:MAG: hypothetical protein ACEQSX_11245, partial [Baekduiaceae bacterium]